MLIPWIYFCALLNCAGWVLSAGGQLNRGGYLVVFAMAGAVWWRYARPSLTNFLPLLNWARWRRRVARGFPLAFLLLAALAVLGGVLHAPTNYDGLAYRVPRTLHWLAAEQWHWIHTDFPRLNNRATGFEWVSLPWLAFTGTDRWLFLPNAISYVFLPSLFFSVLTRLGVRPRVAATWMWLLPTGYCYLLQAGSIANDLTGSFYVLAAVHFALRARRSHAPRDFWPAILAAGLLSSGKTSNLPLLLPWLIAIAPAWRVAIQRPLATLVIGLMAAGASFLPMAAVNHKYTGDWTGLAAEGLELTKGEPVVRVVNNTVLLTLQNFAPPVFPLAAQWNRATAKIIPSGFAAKIQADFEGGGAKWQLGELQVEESAGLGFGISVLLVLSGVSLCSRRQIAGPCPRDRWLTPVLIAAWGALLVFMLKSNLSTAARLASPYFGLLVPLLLLPAGHAVLVRARWWRWCAGLLLLPAFLVIVLSPPRPLWPAQTILRPLVDREFPPPLVQRALTVYEVYAVRHDGFKPLREKLPVTANPLGLVATDTTETSLWRPFGQRRVLHVKATDSKAAIEQRGIRYVLVSEETWGRLGPQPFAAWLKELDAEVLDKMALKLRAGDPPQIWFLIRLNAAAVASRPPPQQH